MRLDVMQYMTQDSAEVEYRDGFSLEYLEMEEVE